jgi:4-diphosphocytidyl-2-C-methyl-D-erythritol kinase
VSVSESVTVRAPAKINLHLGVGPRRDDGYHALATVYQAIGLYDDVTATEADAWAVTLGSTTGLDLSGIPLDEDNIVIRTGRALARHHGVVRAAHLEIAKSIPVAGGLAGGSADAAATLVALNALWHLDLSREDLHSFAAKLGSDVPFALHGGTAFGTGRGERLLPVLSRSTFHWVLALAKGGLSTPTVFRELDRLRAAGTPPKLGGADDLMHALTTGDAATLAPLLGNDLQAAALSLEPRLRRTLRAGVAAGALAGIVSGSGPTCAFLCADADAAVRVSAELAGAGVCRTVRVASGPVPGARIINDAAEGSH